MWVIPKWTSIYSVPFPSPLIWWRHIKNHSIYCDTILCRFGQSRNSSIVPHFTHSVSMRLAFLQANKNPFRKVLVETTSYIFVSWTGLEQSYCRPSLNLKIRAVSSQLLFRIWQWRTDFFLELHSSFHWIILTFPDTKCFLGFFYVELNLSTRKQAILCHFLTK